ncbi:MAG: DUF2851 family protein [Bacteroidetes bacterium]|nr:DUF2851 family protein [Bacteroidota bacterium]
MLKINEELLQFIWQNKIIGKTKFYSINNTEIDVIDFGAKNNDSGPDFFNGKIKLNNIILVGNIEIHVKTSDWNKHKHYNDSAYNNIILHVVFEHDKNIQQNINNSVEVIELKNIISEELINTYQNLIKSKTKLPCSNFLPEVNSIKFSNWLQRLCVERLENKTIYIENLFKEFKGDYHQTLYTILLRSFGFKTNAMPFELLAKHLPLNVLLKHSDNLFQLECLLLGSAGFLNETFKNKYASQLSNEFTFLQNKYNLISLNKTIFKFSKMRPANFPTIRLAQFAALFHKSFSKLCSIENYINIKNELNFETSKYWQQHYNLTDEASPIKLKFGNESLNKLIINAFVPYLFFYSKATNKQHLCDNAIKLLEDCEWESNQKTKHFLSHKNILNSAVESQALIQLFDNYCTKRKCLNCSVGTEILKATV